MVLYNNKFLSVAVQQRPQLMKLHAWAGLKEWKLAMPKAISTLLEYQLAKCETQARRLTVHIIYSTGTIKNNAWKYCEISLPRFMVKVSDTQPPSGELLVISVK